MKSGNSKELKELVDQGIDCYAILGLPSDFPNMRSTDITFQYNKLMAQTGMTDAKREIINDAVSILRDPDLRKKHDNALGHDKLNAAIKVPVAFEGLPTHNQTRTGEVVNSEDAKREHLEKKAEIHAKMIQSKNYEQFGFIAKEKAVLAKSNVEQKQAQQTVEFSQQNNIPSSFKRQVKHAKRRNKAAAAAKEAAPRANSTGDIAESAQSGSGKRALSDDKVEYVDLIKGARDEHRQKMAEKAEKSPLRRWFTGRDKDGLTKNERTALNYLKEKNINKEMVSTVLQDVRSGKIKPTKPGRSM